MTEPVVTEAIADELTLKLRRIVTSSWAAAEQLSMQRNTTRAGMRAEIDATVKAILAALQAAPSPWRPIAEHDGSAGRMNLCWKAFSGLSAHVELGRRRANDVWTNTYGKPFSAAPDYFQPLPLPPGDE